jgi:hypothetical protein
MFIVTYKYLGSLIAYCVNMSTLTKVSFKNMLRKNPKEFLETAVVTVLMVVNIAMPATMVVMSVRDLKGIGSYYDVVENPSSATCEQIRRGISLTKPITIFGPFASGDQFKNNRLFEIGQEKACEGLIRIK